LWSRWDLSGCIGREEAGLWAGNSYDILIASHLAEACVGWEPDCCVVLVGRIAGKEVKIDQKKMHAACWSTPGILGAYLMSMCFTNEVGDSVLPSSNSPDGLFELAG
jgi:hypothetical protein